MNYPDLASDLAAALQVLSELGPLQVLDVHPSPPRRPPTPAAPPAAGQPSLFDPEPEPSTSTNDPLAHLPRRRRWRPVPRPAPPLSPTTSTRRIAL